MHRRDKRLPGKSFVSSGKGTTVGSYEHYHLKRNRVTPAAVINSECVTIAALGCILRRFPARITSRPNNRSPVCC